MAAYWDWLNTVFHPLPEVPTPGSFWSSYFHPSHPLLSFLYPPGWTPETIAEGQSVGVNLIGNDGAAVWRWFATWGDVSPGPRTLRAVELDGALAFLGRPGPVRTLCVDEGAVSPAPGIVVAASNIVVEAGNFTIFVVSITTTSEGLPGGQIFFNTIVAPTAERDALVFGTSPPSTSSSSSATPCRTAISTAS